MNSALLTLTFEVLCLAAHQVVHSANEARLDCAVCKMMLDWHAGAEDICQKKRKKSTGKKPPPSEAVQDAYCAEAASADLATPNAVTALLDAPKAEAVGEQLQGSMPAEPAAQPTAQTSLPADDAAVGDGKADALPTSAEVEEMRVKRKRENGNHPTASQLGLPDVSQSPSGPLSRQVQVSKSSTVLVHYSFLASV